MSALTVSTIEAAAEAAAQIVAQVNGRDVTRGELCIAFDAVANRDNWKLPVDKTVDLDSYTLALVREAVIFYTGSVPTFEALTGTTTSGVGRYRVRAAGYYNTCGA